MEKVRHTERILFAFYEAVVNFILVFRKTNLNYTIIINIYKINSPGLKFVHFHQKNTFFFNNTS